MFPDIDIKSFISLFASCTTTHQVSKFPPTSHRFLSILHLFIHPWFWNNLPVENSCFFFIIIIIIKIPIFTFITKIFFIPLATKYFVMKNFIEIDTGSIEKLFSLLLPLSSLCFAKLMKYFVSRYSTKQKGESDGSGRTIPFQGKKEEWDLTGKLETWSIPFQSNWRS